MVILANKHKKKPLVSHVFQKAAHDLAKMKKLYEDAEKRAKSLDGKLAAYKKEVDLQIMVCMESHAGGSVIFFLPIANPK